MVNLKDEILQNCPICKQSAFVFYKNSIRSLSRCSGCSHVFHSKNKQNVLEYSKDYFNNTHQRWFRHPNIRLYHSIFNKIKTRFVSNGTLLDIGCGPGQFLSFLKSKLSHWEFTGIDLASQSLEFGIQFRQIDILKFEPNCKYDVITAISVIENYQNNPIELMTKLKSLLKPNGIIILVTPDESSLVYSVALNFYNKFKVSFLLDKIYSIENPNHFNKKSTKKLLECSGLIPLELYTFSRPFSSIDTHTNSIPIDLLARVGVSSLSHIGERLNRGMLLVAIAQNSTD